MYFENKVLKGMILTHVDDFLYCGADGFEEKVMIPLSKRFVVGSRDEKDFKYIGLHIVQEENFDIFVDLILSYLISDPQSSSYKPL